MSKSQATPSKIVVETKIGKLCFRQTPKGTFIVGCRGHDRIRIRLARDSKTWQADGKAFDKVGAETIITGRSPEQTFKRAIKAFWLS